MKSIVTGNKGFNKLFINNPIDKAYLTGMEKTTSAVDIIKVNEEYTKLWQMGVDSGYKKLLAKTPDSKKKSYQNHQEEQVKGIPNDLRKIIEKAQSTGTMARLEASGGTMEFYRERTAVAYKSLYTHDAKLTYAYSAKK